MTWPAAKARGLIGTDDDINRAAGPHLPDDVGCLIQSAIVLVLPPLAL